MNKKVFKAGAARILADTEWFPAAVPDIFDPKDYLNARPVSEGGRSAAWFIDTDYGPAVLRHFRRGGLVAKIISSRYLRTGASRCRAFKEFEILAVLAQKGVPTARPLAAIYQPRGLGAEMAIITQHIENTVPLSAKLRQSDLHSPQVDHLASACAKTIRLMHEAGVWHADLNAFNLLVDDQGTVHVIDLDRGLQKNITPSLAEANLQRLRRSLVKENGQNGDDFWQTLKNHYNTFSKTSHRV